MSKDTNSLTKFIILLTYENENPRILSINSLFSNNKLLKYVKEVLHTKVNTIQVDEILNSKSKWTHGFKLTKKDNVYKLYERTVTQGWITTDINDKCVATIQLIEFNGDVDPENLFQTKLQYSSIISELNHKFSKDKSESVKSESVKSESVKSESVKSESKSKLE